MPKRHKKHHPTYTFRLEGGLLLEKESPKLDFEGLRTDLLCSFEFYRTAIISLLTCCHYKLALILVKIDYCGHDLMSVTLHHQNNYKNVSL